MSNIEETIEKRYEHKFAELKEIQEYQVFKAAADAKIKGAAMRENFERLLRVMFLRDTKEQLKQNGQWSKYCEETGIDIKNADYEIDKLGEFKDELLLKFGEHCGYQINKIKYLTSGNSEKLGVTVENGEIFVKGERVPLTPDDVQSVVEALQNDLAKQEEKAEKEKADIEKEHAETKKALKRVEKELKSIKKDAAAKGISPEEAAFLKEMEAIKTSFDEIINRIDDAGFVACDVAPRMAATAKTTIDYMKHRLANIWVKEVET